MNKLKLKFNCKFFNSIYVIKLSILFLNKNSYSDSLNNYKKIQYININYQSKQKLLKKSNKMISFT